MCELFSQQEIAKQLQEEEEMEMRQQRVAAGYNDNDCVSPLCEGNCFFSQMLDVNAGITCCTTGFGLPPSGLGVLEQVLQDAELARRLQEEEDMLPHREVCYIECLHSHWRSATRPESGFRPGWG